MKKIYLDYAATTPVDPEVLEAMKPYFSQKFGNASSLHEWGREASKALEDSREKIAELIKVEPGEICFTSGGTESNNIAIKGVAFANKEKGKHIITSSIEHHAVLNVCKWLESQGFEVTYLPVDKDGLVDPTDLEKAIRDDTILVSIMHANNEIGTIQDLRELSRITHEKGVYFHTDAVQSFGKIPINLEFVDLMSVSGHKIYGPKGAGFLYVREGVKITPLFHGGGHERGLRSSTENIPGIVGLAKAAEISFEKMEEESKREEKLRDELIKKVLEIPDSWLNGHAEKRLPNNANFGFDFIEGEALVMLLDEKGVAASTGSACSSHELKPSHVLTAVGLPPEKAHGSLRITIGRHTKQEDIEYTERAIKESVENLRKLS